MPKPFKTTVPGPFINSGRGCNVVQTLLKRELGFPMFTNSTDSMSNHVAEKAICRQILYSRIPNSPSGQLILNQMELDETWKPAKSVTGPRKSVPQMWFAIKVEKRAQVNFIDGLFWKSTTAGSSVGQRSNTFFKLEPDHTVGYKVFDGYAARGKQTQFEVISTRALSSVKSLTYLIVLRENGLVNVTNLSSMNQLKNTITLSLRLTSEPERSLRFTDMSFDWEQQQMFILASVRGYAQRLYIVQFPSWHINTIVYIKVPLKIQLWSSILMTYDAKGIDIMDVANFVDASEKYTLPELNQKNDAKCTNVRVLTRKPTLGIKISTSYAFFGLRDTTWPPIYYIRDKTGIKIYTFQESTLIWEHELGPFNNFLFQPMPDNSNSVLFTDDEEQIMITWKKIVDDPPSYLVDRCLAFQLELGTPDATSVVSPVARERPELKRNCKSPSKIKEPITRVLAMDYFENVDLLAICAVFDEKLIVTVYEALSFKFFRTLPTLNIVDTRNLRSQSSDSNISKIDRIARVGLQFDYDLMFVEISYDNYSEKEMYGMRIVQENVSDQL